MHKTNPEEQKLLTDFLLKSYARPCDCLKNVAMVDEVTVLMYFFWEQSRAEEHWPLFEGALKETWRNCGMLKTVLVSNARHSCLVDFADAHPNVEIQVESDLIPGDINSMSIDCNSKLHTRFSTRFVLIVQDDGFPVRPGLDEFVAKGYDFIGSPYCRPKLIPDLLTRLLNYCPSNGGFSLRTRHMCRLAAELWNREYTGREFVVEEMSEDFFYTKTLPNRSLRFRMRRRQAPSIISERFSYEGAFPLAAKSLPFGFHTATGFATLVRRFGLMNESQRNSRT